MTEKGISQLSKDVLASFAGSAWSALTALLVVPFYLRYLGAEGYGLVGFSTTLFSILVFLDAGLTLTVNRELAKLSHRASDQVALKETLYAGTAIFTVLALAIFISLCVSAPWIVRKWLRVGSGTLGIPEAVISIRLIGLVVSEQLLVALFQSSLLGIHRQITANLILIIAVTVRSVGAVLILSFVSHKPSVFFGWYALTFLIQLTVQFRALLSRIHQAFTHSLRFSVVKTLLRQTGGVGLIAIVSLLLSQIDKVLVSRLLPLDEFGYYMVAASVSLLPVMIAGPFTSAVFPHFSRLAISDRDSARELLHHATKLVSAFVIPLGFTIALFSGEIVFAWTGSVLVTSRVAPLVSLLVGGYAINASLQMSYYFEMAHSRTRGTVIAISVALVLLLPGLVILSRFGAVGIASGWLLINCFLFVLGAPFALHPGLRGALWRYYMQSLLPFFAIAAAVVVLARILVPYGSSRVIGGEIALATFAITVLTCFLVVPALRTLLRRRVSAVYASVIRAI